MKQQDLFADFTPEPPDQPDPPAQRHSPTSVGAAAEIAADAPTLRARVLAFVRRHGAYGATDEEVQRGLGMNPSTERPRRVELVRAGQLVDSGARRKTSSGRQAVVWATPDSLALET